MEAIRIDPADGAILIDDVRFAFPGQDDFGMLALQAAKVREVRDMGNGYEWLTFQDLQFGGRACVLSVCCRETRVVEASWGMVLPEAALEDGWPTMAAIEAEIAFVRGELAAQLGRPFEGIESFDWGSVGSVYDQKGGIAHSFVRYA